MSFRNMLPCGVVLAAVLLAAPGVRAATIVVQQVNFSFVPSVITIEEGDTVEWQWTSTDHTVTEGAGPFPVGGEAFDEPLSSGNPTVSVTFDAAFLAANPRPGNVYDYYCIPHFAFGMLGQITVTAAPPPVIPTMSTWGVILLGALLLGAGAILLNRRRTAIA